MDFPRRFDAFSRRKSERTEYRNGGVVYKPVRRVGELNNRVRRRSGRERSRVYSHIRDPQRTRIWPDQADIIDHGCIRGQIRNRRLEQAIQGCRAGIRDGQGCAPETRRAIACETALRHIDIR